MSFTPIRKYTGNQVILTSDRLIFNSKEDNIFITTKKDLAISAAESVHINADQSLIVNTPKIKLGIKNVQPVPKGDNLNNTLTQLLNALNSLAANLSTAQGFGVGTVTTPTINAAGVQLQGEITNLKSLVKSINSTVTFTS